MTEAEFNELVAQRLAAKGRDVGLHERGVVVRGMSPDGELWLVVAEDPEHVALQYAPEIKDSEVRWLLS